MKNSALKTLTSASILSIAVAGISLPAQAITFSGTSSGSWGLPAGTFGASLSNEDGGTNNRLTWGTPIVGSVTNYVQYDGLDFSTDVDTLFAVGDLTYRNGAVFTSSHNFEGDFPLEVEFSLTNPLNSAESFSYTFNIEQTLNTTGDPVLDGDILTFTANGLTNDFFNFGGVDYTLKLAGFSSDGGNTFLSLFNSPEDSVANAILYAEIIKGDIPEPTTIFGLGLLGVYLTGSLKKKRQ